MHIQCALEFIIQSEWSPRRQHIFRHTRDARLRHKPRAALAAFRRRASKQKVVNSNA